MRTRAQIEAASRATASWYMAGDSIVARVLGKTKMLLDPKDMSLTPHLVMDGFWESWVTVWCLANVTPNDKVLNIGANCGYFALLFARETQEVVAVEPQPRLADRIRWSARLNGFDNLRVVEAIAGAMHRDGVLMKCYDGLTGSAHVTAAYEDGCIYVTEVPAHELLPGATCVFIDAEGHEPHIWKGLGPALERNVRWVALEWAPSRYADAPAFLAELHAWGDVMVIDHDGDEKSVQDADLLRGSSGDWEMLVIRRHGMTEKSFSF